MIQGDRIYLVKMGCKPTELEQLMLLKVPGKLDVVEVVEAVDRITECLVVLLLDEQVVVRVVDGLDVQLEER